MSIKRAVEILDTTEKLLAIPGGELHNLVLQARDELLRELSAPEYPPIPMRLPCPGCGKLHLDEGVFAEKPHHTHACQHCGLVWRPAKVNTVGVQFLPGYRNAASNGG